MIDGLKHNFWVAAALATTALGLTTTALTLATATADTIAAKPPNTKDGQPYSEPTANKIPLRVMWGDAHLHTEFSFDAGLVGTRLSPEDAFRFARGDEVISTTGVPAQLRHPLDFLVVTDHSNYLGLPLALREGSPAVVNDPTGKRWYDAVHSGEGGFKVFTELAMSLAKNTNELKSDELVKSTWARSVAAAEKYNEPGRFTAFIGFEWTSTPGGNNLHHNVIFRDAADKALQIVPITTFDSEDPEKLWAWLADYEKKTGGQALCIPHNSNLSGGLMFADKTFGGKPFDKPYAEARAKWEPVAEITQTKGDSETDPIVSPDDEFANFERWDKMNILMTQQDKPEEQQFNYLRPALTHGIKYAQTIGANPFKYGFIGSSDNHTGLTAVAADNFFGVTPGMEPGPDRMKGGAFGGKAPDSGALRNLHQLNQSEMASSGLAAVWATENTRGAIFDAIKRRETYATTGTRITVRLFAGWDFKPADAARSDFAAYGYAHGVPMGGDLSGAHAGQKATLVIQAAKDPDGANLDRVQVIKGWVDTKGDTHEKIFDVAWSGDRKASSDGKLPLVGSTVDVANASYSNAIGAAVLDTAWTDPTFNPAERAYYYVRVIEIPTPRWTTIDAKRFGVDLPANVPASVTQRAYTSPVWYAPSGT
ncbi:MAG TPA: DUF3604 domain-containing protein [Alphaproteobacteria bacterium]|jgi:hypothetical protein|nr:DUF3604 domain-containing protein [Alphaproteobacteria bacterium]